jgi:hypothetical protein
MTEEFNIYNNKLVSRRVACVPFSRSKLVLLSDFGSDVGIRVNCDVGQQNPQAGRRPSRGHLRVVRFPSTAFLCCRSNPHRRKSRFVESDASPSSSRPQTSSPSPSPSSWSGSRQQSPCRITIHSNIAICLGFVRSCVRRPFRTHPQNSQIPPDAIKTVRCKRETQPLPFPKPATRVQQRRDGGTNPPEAAHRRTTRLSGCETVGNQASGDSGGDSTASEKAAQSKTVVKMR